MLRWWMWMLAVGAVVGTVLTAQRAEAANAFTLMAPDPTQHHWQPLTFTNCNGGYNGANPQGRAFAGIMSGGGYICYWGGGHGAYPGNDVSCYNTVLDRWESDTRQPECYAPCCVNPSDPNTVVKRCVSDQSIICSAATECPGAVPGSCKPSLCDSDPVDTDCSADPYNANCLSSSCILSGGSGVSKMTYRCTGGIDDGMQCSQDSECTGGVCTTGVATRVPAPGQICTTCRPYVEHSYQRQAYNPQRAAYTVFALSGTWEYNRLTQEWTWLGYPPPKTADQASLTMLWNPSVNKMTFIEVGTANGGVYQFTYPVGSTAGSWARVKTVMPLGNGQGESFSTYDARSNLIVLVSRPASTRIFTLDAGNVATASWNEITSLFPADITVNFCTGGTRPCWTSGMSYDVSNQRTLFLTQDTGTIFGLWAYDSLASTVTRVTTTMIPTALVPQAGYPNAFACDGVCAIVDRHAFWTNGTGGTIRTWTIDVDLGAPLPTWTPTNTPTRTATPTPLVPTATPTATPTCAGGGTTWTVGPVGRNFTTLAQAAASASVVTGACIHVDAGNYTNDVVIWPASKDNLTIRGIGGRAKLTITNGAPAGGKGIFVVDGDNTTIENFEFSCATSRVSNPNCSGVHSDPADQNYAGIRIEAPGLTVRNCSFHDNDDGIIGGPTGTNVTPPSGTVTVERSEFFRNGHGDGQSHNIYVNERNSVLVFRENYSHGAVVGHQFKSRAGTSWIINNRFGDENGNGYTNVADCGGNTAAHCDSSVAVELPCGGLSYIIGNVMHKSALADTPDFIKVASEIVSPDCPPTPYATQETNVINNTMVSALAATRFVRWGFGSFPTCGNAAGTTPTLRSINNIFIGPTGSIQNCWGVTGPLILNNNILATSMSFVSSATYDYHLTASATTAINQGITPPVDGMSVDLGRPLNSLYPGLYPNPLQVVYTYATETRPVDANWDVGAFEYVAPAVTAFPTATNTPTNTRTPSPVFSPTPAVPAFCGAGETETVFPVVASADDGWMQRSGSNYAALGSAVQRGYLFNGYSFTTLRQNSGSSPYKVELYAWRFNTAVRPDGTGWPAGTTVTSARLRPYWTTGGSGTRNLVFEWNNWTPPISDTVWTLNSVVPADPTYALSMARTATCAGNCRDTLSLSNAPTNVNLSGYTGLRLTFADATPPAASEVNLKGVHSQEYFVTSGRRETDLVLCTTTNPLVPTFTPTVTPTSTPFPTDTVAPVDTDTPTPTATATATDTPNPTVAARRLWFYEQLFPVP